MFFLGCFFLGCFLLGCFFFAGGCFWDFLGCLWKEMLRTGHLKHEFAHGVGNHAWICFKLPGGWLHDAIATIAAMSGYILDQTRHCKIPQFYPYSRMIFPWKEWISMGSMANLGLPNGRSQLPWSNNDQSTSQPVKAQMKSRTFLVGPEAGGVFVDRESMEIFHKLPVVWWTAK